MPLETYNAFVSANVVLLLDMSDVQGMTSLEIMGVVHIIHRFIRLIRYIRFIGGYRFYQFTALPFSIATVCLEFTKVAKVLKLMALAEGISIHQYIDGWLMTTNSKQQLPGIHPLGVHLVESLGWITNF